MKCVRKRSTAEQLETCGIWLDTAKLKKRKIQTLVSKPTSNMPNPLLERNYNSHISVNFTQTRLSQPYTRQTTISSFFSIQPTGEKDDEENLKTHPLMSNKGKGSDFLAASSMKSSGAAKLEEAQAPTLSPQEDNIQECSQLLVQNTQGLNIPLLNYTFPQAQSNSRSECTAIARTSAGETEDFLSINFTQDSEENRVLAHRNSDDSFTGRISVANGIISRKRESYFIGEKEGHLCSERGRTRVGLKPTHLKQGRRRCKNLPPGGISFMDVSEVENVCPAPKGNEGQQTNYPLSQGRTTKAELLRDSSQNFAAFWTRNCHNMAGSEEEQGPSESSPTTQLFTQDSEGHRVISHQHFYKSVRSPLQKKYLQDKTNFVQRVPSPPSVDCFKVYSSGARDRTPLATTAMNLCEPESCYDLLFTEDSEGNRIIKH
ncbi:aurora kinase A and ninein-interacting protein isoform X1 [Malaclemys terrapin pileata]|uniref:aurora kinase A and ninein-interacting protein isoform X1 n=2 Tax=Malaclemys terrapin pileata TaxID=2991368 RepID=UPI0023A90ACC|nr:aurora kinase A and ninein-interacting protein isoform X1 [Malaclemys terrapin pileata]XP_053867503.1 aurora kinase A and ninein-interacting protein isoform X1 [Malaclemys terrapin pileata]XP_053867504.1 aurora kinase A and ninein-interacting protein isoform X1 [Malaclemys terrapin pileata]XP_053867505.1 aurora kinase A and ninein-interacting protein isoform X1 [Malaclemys terrapin pileata]XP_053867506.1 aurora kinase A and ninein-interacting protein isoform X1 [Malaclemys terrapin pileata]